MDRLAKQGPLADAEILDEAAVAFYEIPRALCGPSPVNHTWMLIRSLLKAVRAKDRPEQADLVQVLSATLGEMIADLPVERQTQVVQVHIHQVFAYAEQLRTPGFDQPHGAIGHA